MPIDSSSGSHYSTRLRGTLTATSREAHEILTLIPPDMDAARASYDEVYVYSMSRPGFILQHVADAFTVQTSDHTTKPISLVFGLAGLYLRVEGGFSGREVQQSHTKLARQKRDWPKVYLPEDRGSLTIAHVMAASAGTDRDNTIDDWCRSVWTAFSDNRDVMVALLREYELDHPS